MKKFIPIILACVLLLLQAFPISAVLLSEHDGQEVFRYYSAFDLRPFMDGNFAPLIVAILSVALLSLCVCYLFRPSKKLKKAVFTVACVAMLLAFCPLFYSYQCYSIVDCAIAFILFVQTMIFVERAK